MLRLNKIIPMVNFYNFYVLIGINIYFILFKKIYILILFFFYNKME